MSIFATDYVDSKKGWRLPNEAYHGKNAFLSPPSATELSQASGAEVPSDTALARHRTAMYILTQKDRPIPSLEEMREDIKPENDTLENVQARIAAAQDQHLSDLQRMYAWHAEEYLEEARDQYLSWDSETYQADPTFDAFYDECRRSWPFVLTCEDDISLLHYTHLQLMRSLWERHAELKRLAGEQMAREEEERKKREADFPMSKEEFEKKSKDVQQRVVMLLTMGTDVSGKEKMMNEYNWAWRQVKPLTDLFEKDKEFNALIVSQRIALDMEGGLQKDPRKRGSV